MATGERLVDIKRRGERSQIMNWFPPERLAYHYRQDVPWLVGEIERLQVLLVGASDDLRYGDVAMALDLSIDEVLAMEDVEVARGKLLVQRINARGTEGE